MKSMHDDGSSSDGEPSNMETRAAGRRGNEARVPAEASVGTLHDDSVRCDLPSDFPPQEDHIERLWTPQRMAYVLAPKNAESAKVRSCPFCEAPRKSDEDGLIVWRGARVFVIMNLYPYNVGHVMVCPYRHVGMLTDLDDDELFEFEKLSTQAMRVMAMVSHPDGWNLGINQGAVAGAGVASHLHQHVVPRWNGDANFMPIVAQTRTMPILLSDQRKAYADTFMRVFGGEAGQQPKEKEI